MRRTATRTLLFASVLLALTAAGCSELVTPQPGEASHAMDFAWRDSSANYHYVSSSGSGDHAVRVSAGGIVNDSTFGGGTQWSLQRTATEVQLTGLGFQSLIPLAPNSSIVAGFAPQSDVKFLHARQLLSARGAGLFVVVGDELYQYNDASDTLVDIAALPTGIDSLVLDERTGDLYGRSGSRVLRFNGFSWTTFATMPAPVTAITFDDSLYAAVLGSGVYSWPSGQAKLQIPETARINSILVQHDLSNDIHVYAGTDDGRLLDREDDGQIRTETPVPGTPAIWAIETNGAETVLATSAGLYLWHRMGPTRWQLIGNPAPILASTTDLNQLVFATPQAFQQWSFPTGPGTPTPPTNFAPGLAAPHDLVSNSGSVYVLSHDTVFIFNGSRWQPINQNEGSVSGPKPGVFRLLVQDSASWTAAYVLEVAGGVLHKVVYTAQVLEPEADELRIAGAEYDHVKIVQYSPGAADGLPLPQDAPRITIYFERGTGPVRIERQVLGVTDTLVLRR